MTQDEQKRAVAEAALAYVEDDMVVGVGTGSTANFFIDALAGMKHRIEGTVIGGEQRGRDLGFPTANIALEGLHLPAFGVYAVLVDVLDGAHAGSYHGAASLGVRPMFGGQVPNLETFLFDFTGDLYGATLSVALVDYLRPEAKFDGLDALITQMQADCDAARGILAAL